MSVKIPAYISGIRNARSITRSVKPMPSLLATSSEITVRISAIASAMRIPATMLGDADGSTIFQMISRVVRPNVRAVSSRTRSTPAMPWMVLTTIGKKHANAMTKIFIGFSIPRNPPRRSRVVLPTGRRSEQLLHMPAVAEEARVLARRELVARIRELVGESFDGVARTPAEQDDRRREIDRLLDVVGHEHHGL